MPSIDVERWKGDVVSLVLKKLEASGLEPKLIPQESIMSLRGGHSCFDLKSGRGLDTVVLVSRTDVGKLEVIMSETFYRLDYAVRGNIKGILPWRIMAKTDLRTKGLIRKRHTGLGWKVPLEVDVANKRWFGLPPGPGELYEDGPHQKLIDSLNEDAGLMESIKKFVYGKRSSFLLYIISDQWGESIRICGSQFISSEKFLDTYAAPLYIDIVEQIGRHIKEVRREYGGIAF